MNPALEALLVAINLMGSLLWIFGAYCHWRILKQLAYNRVLVAVPSGSDSIAKDPWVAVGTLWFVAQALVNRLQEVACGPTSSDMSGRMGWHLPCSHVDARILVCFGNNNCTAYKMHPSVNNKHINNENAKSWWYPPFERSTRQPNQQKKYSFLDPSGRLKSEMNKFPPSYQK